MLFFFAPDTNLPASHSHSTKPPEMAAVVSKATRHHVGSTYKLIVNSAWPGGTALMHEQIGSAWPSISTSQAWQEPIKHPVGIVIPARSATCNKGSPISALTVTSSGTNFTLTVILAIASNNSGSLNDRRWLTVNQSNEPAAKSPHCQFAVPNNRHK